MTRTDLMPRLTLLVTTLRRDLLALRRGTYRMAMPDTTGNWTVAMLDALPEDGQRYEIIDGVLFDLPSFFGAVIRD